MVVCSSRYLYVDGVMRKCVLFYYYLSERPYDMLSKHFIYVVRERKQTLLILVYIQLILTYILFQFNYIMKSMFFMLVIQSMRINSNNLSSLSS
jgi:hypothetical protein